MARKGYINIKTGTGKTAPDQTGTILTHLNRTPPTPPSLEEGVVGYVDADGEIRDGLSPNELLQNGAAGLKALVQSHSTMDADQIVLNPLPPFVESKNVQGGINELEGFAPGEPPKIGMKGFSTSEFMIMSGIPDWGILKLNDNSIQKRDSDLYDIVNPNDPAGVYPYYLVPPAVASDPINTYPGADPITDPMFNSCMTYALNPTVSYPGYLGTGTGQTYAGGYPLRNSHLQRTDRLLKVASYDVEPAVPFWQPCAVSGVVYPADRGVLALLHFPVNTETIDDFIAQDLLDRCVAAIVLGQGLYNEGAPCGSPEHFAPKDGEPGGLFCIGYDGYDILGNPINPNPLAYPGKATGQFDYWEICMGKNADGQFLPAPWVDGQHHISGSLVPILGQVRLGTDPTAGTFTPSLPYGIPILGAGIEAYDTSVPHYNTVDATWAYIGNTFFIEITGPSPVSFESNFFKYRLPCLSDYSSGSGLPFTPKGIVNDQTLETKRYFTLPYPSAYGMFTDPTYNNPWKWHETNPVLSSAIFDIRLEQAGNYPNFKQDNWNWQIARYRHNFLAKPAGIPDPNDPAPSITTPNDIGSYWLVHFKTEASFEAFVRDGEVSALDNIYGAHLVGDLTPADENVVNQETGEYPIVRPPFGPAPDYGYSAWPYHTVRANIRVSNIGRQAVVTTDFLNKAFTWNYTTDTTPLDGIMFCSGVGYFLPTKTSDYSISSFTLTGIDVVVDAFPTRAPWFDSYRTDDKALTDPLVAPALNSSPNPAFINLAPFSYGLLESNPSYLVPTTKVALDYQREQHLELPFTSLGSFNDNMAPTDIDQMVFYTDSSEPLEVTSFLGDPLTPAFSTNALPRVFIRRPLMQGEWETAVQPANGYSLWGSIGDPVTDYGQGLALVAGVPNQILFHSASSPSRPAPTPPYPGPDQPRYGNFAELSSLTIPPWPPTSYYKTPVSLVSAEKDTHEKFLDEAYRYFIPSSDVYATDYYSDVIGPGLPYPEANGINIAVRAGDFDFWDTTPTVLLTDFLLSWVAFTIDPFPSPAWNYDLNNIPLDASLQVAGLPDRNPFLSDWVKGPFPSVGLLKYPNIDYSTGFSPSATELVTQPNYASAFNVRQYARCFDAAFSYSFPAADITDFDSLHPYDPEVIERKSFCLRLDGIELKDFQAPHCFPLYTDDATSNPDGTEIAVLVKVPGKTNWMDAGLPLYCGSDVSLITKHFTWDIPETDPLRPGDTIDMFTVWADAQVGDVVSVSFDPPLMMGGGTHALPNEVIDLIGCVVSAGNVIFTARNFMDSPFKYPDPIVSDPPDNGDQPLPETYEIFNYASGHYWRALTLLNPVGGLDIGALAAEVWAGTPIAATRGYLWYSATEAGAWTHLVDPGIGWWTTVTTVYDNLGATFALGAASWNGGIWYSLDSAATWTLIAGLAPSSPYNWTSMAGFYDSFGPSLGPEVRFIAAETTTVMPSVGVNATYNVGDIWLVDTTGLNFNITGSGPSPIGEHQWQSLVTTWDDVTKDVKIIAVANDYVISDNEFKDYIYTIKINLLSYVPTYVKEDGVDKPGLQNWQAIACSSDGVHIVAVAKGANIWTGTLIAGDYSWTERTASGKRDWQTVSCDATGQYLVAGVGGGYLYTSGDSGDWGATWTQAPDTTEGVPGFRYWYTTATSRDGNYMLAGAYGDLVYTGAYDAVVWTGRADTGVAIPTGAFTFFHWFDLSGRHLQYTQLDEPFPLDPPGYKKQNFMFRNIDPVDRSDEIGAPGYLATTAIWYPPEVNISIITPIIKSYGMYPNQGVVLVPSGQCIWADMTIISEVPAGKQLHFLSTIVEPNEIEEKSYYGLLGFTASLSRGGLAIPKNDPTRDGSGCLIEGEKTFDDIDPESRMVYCQMEISDLDADNKIALFNGYSHEVRGDTRYEVPVLVKIMMGSTEISYNIPVGEYDLTASADGSVVGPGTSASLIRGITGIRILHPNDVQKKEE